jgi:hypothetical protein
MERGKIESVLELLNEGSWFDEYRGEKKFTVVKTPLMYRE